MPRSSLAASAVTCSLAAWASACGDTTITQLTGPSETGCTVSANAPLQPLAADGDRIIVNAAASRDCLWTASSQSSWLQVSPATGQGSGVLTIVATANASGDLRIGAILINEARLTVTQGAPPASSPPAAALPSETGSAPAPTPSPDPEPVPASNPPATPVCSVAVNPRTATFDEDGGTGTISVSSTAGCSWSATSTGGWIEISSGRSGTGPGTVRYSVDRHKGKGTRNGSITVGGITVSITQTGKD